MPISIQSKISLLIIICLLFSCKEDKQRINEHISPEEKKYFEDYKSSFYKWGFIDTFDRLIVPNKYDALRDFSDSLAGANFNGRWGFININGEIRIPHKYRAVKSFTNGFAFCQKFDFSWDCVDKEAKVVFNIDKVDAVNHNGRYFVYQKNGLWGLKTMSNEEILECKYSKIKLLGSNIAVNDKGVWNLFDYSRMGLMNQDFDKIYLSDSELIKIKKNGKYGFVDSKGRIIINPIYEEASDFNNKTAFVKHEGKGLFINTKGQELMEVQFDRIRSINEGKWAYFENGYWGLIGQELQKLSEPKYKFINKYFEGILGFGVSGDHWGYLNQKGEEIIPAVLPIIWDYKNGFVRIIDRTGMGMLNRNAKLVIEPKYPEIRDFHQNRARVQLR